MAIRGTLQWNYFEIGTLAAKKMSFKGFSIFSSSHHFVQPSGTILAILVEGSWRNTSMQIFWNRAISQGRDVVWRFSIFSSGSHLVPWSRTIAAILDFRLTCFDPEVILLLQSKFRLKVTKVTKGLWRYWKLIFKMAVVVAILDFPSILCQLRALMLIKFWFMWIIEEISKIWILSIFPI